MERTTVDRGTPRRRGWMQVWLLAGASVTVLAAAATAHGQVSGDERVYRQEALAHAGAVEAAWRRLETFILEESGAATSWPGAVPPAATGWQAGWTARGLEARYCDDTLLVYLAPEALKGTGSDHRAVHAAPHAYDGGDRPVLHWLESGTAHGGAGRAGVTLPACLSAAGAGGPLPSGRAALAGGVRDPFVHLTDRVTRETREEPCPDGEHGAGRTLIREATQAHDGRGNRAGDPVFGPWELSIDLCRADYSQWEHYTLACHWDAGPPHDRRMEGREVWRRLKTVTAGGESLGPPQFVSTSCWTGEALPPPPEPEIGETTHEETKSGSCPAGYTGILGADAARLAAGVAASPDPALAWFEDARRPADRRGAEKIARNNALFDAWGADAVPLIVWRTREGTVGMRVGDVDDADAWLRETLGPETLGPETLGPETLVPETLVPETLGPETLGPEAGLE